jgi:hypothetical protein
MELGDVKDGEDNVSEPPSKRVKVVNGNELQPLTNEVEYLVSRLSATWD